MASLKWFGPESLDVPQFMLDELEEGTQWEKIEGETHQASTGLVSVRGDSPLSWRRHWVLWRH
jgi:hypothetical protein